MRRHACALPLVTVCLLFSIATAYAECARVLWETQTSSPADKSGTEWQQA